MLAMGNPLGLTGSVTDGIVSALGRTVTEPAGDGSPGATFPDAIQTRRRDQPRQQRRRAGRPVGQVIGIPTLAATDPQTGGGAAPGIGFAIPSNMRHDIAAQIVRYGKVTNSHRAALGIRGSTITGSGGQPGGVGIVGDLRGGPAAAACMPGDVIVKVNGTATPTASDLTEVLANLSPGQKATVTVLQPDGSTADVSVTLGTLPG